MAEPHDANAERRPSRLPSALVAVLVLAAVAAMGFVQVSSADTGFHLATGRLVLATRHIPATNVLSYTEPDHPWVAHEWLSGVLFELVWRAAGPAGLLGLKLALLLATFACVLAAARRLGASPLAAGLATALGAAACASRFVERPQLFSNAVLAAVALLLARRLVPRTDQPRCAWGGLVGAAALVVANYQLHAGALNSLILMACVAVGVAFEPWLLRRGGAAGALPSAGSAWRRGVADAWPFALAAVAALVASALALWSYHPHGIAPLWVPFELGTDPALRVHVIEYRPPYAFPFAQLAPYWFFAGALGLAIVGVGRRLSPAWRLAAAAFLLLSLRHVRVMDATAVVGAPVLAVGLSLLGRRLVAGAAPDDAPHGGARGARIRAGLPRLAAGLVLGALVLFGPLWQWRQLPAGPGLNRRVWPWDLFALVRSEGWVGPTFVSDGWGGPFLAEFYPPERVFFDPRFEAYSRDFFENVYRRIRYGEPGWDGLLDRYGVELVLLKYTSPGEAAQQRGAPNLRQRLLEHPGWALVGFNDFGELFVRRAGKNASRLAGREVPALDPDRAEFVGAPALAAPSLRGLLARGWRDNQVLVLAAVALGDAGRRDEALRLLDEARAREPDDPRIASAERLLAAQ